MMDMEILAVDFCQACQKCLGSQRAQHYPCEREP